MMIGPTRDAIDKARGDFATAQRAVQEAPALTVASVAWKKTEARGAALQDLVIASSEGALDSAELTQRLYDTAAECGLTLTRIQPSSQRISSVMRPDGTPDAAPQAALRVSLDTTASYDAVVRFLDVLERDLGFVRIESVRLTPVSPDGVQSVRATIETVHFAFVPALAEPATQTTALQTTVGGAQ